MHRALNLSDAWYNRNTLGQGVIVTVYPGLNNVFASNFTFDTLRPPAEVEAIFGEPGHRWLTGFGPFAGSVATLEVELTSGGVFNAPSPTPNQETDYGTWTLRFNDCNSLTLVYDFPELNISGVMDLIRLADDNVDLCLELGFP